VQQLERARALDARGRTLAAMGRQAEARRAFDEAASIFESQGARGDLASTLRQIGELSATAGEFVQAIESYRAALDALEPLGLGPYAIGAPSGAGRSAPAISLVGA
jgi:tetratricopeptide (TPR) repeat protein